MFKIKFHKKDDAMGHYCEVLEKSLKKKRELIALITVKANTYIPKHCDKFPAFRYSPENSYKKCRFR